MSVVDSWILIGVSVASLWVLWRILNLVFTMIEIWFAGPQTEDSSPRRERGH